MSPSKQTSSGYTIVWSLVVAACIRLKKGISTMFCTHCGMESPKAARFCPSCGTAITEPETSGAATKGRTLVAAGVGRLLIAGLVLVCAVGALVIYINKASVLESALHAFASKNGTDDVWDGLDPKEVLAAKHAMDADIEQEER